MKFRAILTDITCINHFSRVIQTAAKLGKSSVIRLTPDKFCIIQIESSNRNRCHMWCQLEKDHFFQDYCMKGVTEEQNEIYFEIMTENMVQALKLAQNAKSVTIKLTKRHGASLTHEIELPSVTSGSRLLTHDLPINLVLRSFWDDYQEPIMPAYNVSLVLPSLLALKNIVDRMKNVGNLVVVSATKTGGLVLKVESETVTVSATFTKLISSTFSNEHKCDVYEARVDLRNLAQLLNCQQLCPNKIVCNIQTDRVVHFLLAQQGLLLQYFMPAVST